MKYRIEKDSLGDVKVPADALWGAQTQRALENFKISGIKFTFPFGRSFIEALGVIKYSAASSNQKLKLLKIYLIKKKISGEVYFPRLIYSFYLEDKIKHLGII